jgi:hypothetical protein
MKRQKKKKPSKAELQKIKSEEELIAFEKEVIKGIKKSRKTGKDKVTFWPMKKN